MKKDLHRGKYRLVTTQQQTGKNKQIHSLININDEHLENITKVNKYKKLNSTSTTEHKLVHNYTLVNQAIIIRKSNNGVTKEIDHICNNNRKSFKGRKKRRTGK